MDTGLDHSSTYTTARNTRKYCENLQARLEPRLTGRHDWQVNSGWQVEVVQCWQVDPGWQVNREKNCSLFDLLTCQPIYHDQAENSHNFISLFSFFFFELHSFIFIFLFNYIPYRYSVGRYIFENQEGYFFQKLQF